MLGGIHRSQGPVRDECQLMVAVIENPCEISLRHNMFLLSNPAKKLRSQPIGSPDATFPLLTEYQLEGNNRNNPSQKLSSTKVHHISRPNVAVLGCFVDEGTCWCSFRVFLSDHGFC